MNRYIDSLKLVEDVEMSKKFNPHEDPVMRAMHNHEHEHFFTLIARQPVAEVAPMAEVKLLGEKLASARKAKAEVTREIFEEIEREITDALKSNYKVLPQVEESEALWNNVNGKINALRGIEYFITELKKKYTDATDTNDGHK